MTSPKPASASRQAKLLSAAAKAAKNFAAILDFDQILQKTVDIIREEFDFYYAGIFLIDPTGKYAVLQAGYGEAGKAMLAENHRLEIGGNSMIGDCIAKKRARISLDVGEEAVFFKNPHLPKTRSEMGLPLILGSTVLGALTVQSTQQAAFTEEDISALQTMADQLAIAIENARLHRKEQRRANYLEASNAVGKQLTTILDLDELLPQTVNVICSAYDFYYAGVFLTNPTGKHAVLKAGYGEAGQAMLAENHQLEIGGNSMIGDCIANKRARISLDVGEEKVFFKNPHLPETRSEMGLPLIIGDDVLGALTVQSTQEAAFSEEDISTLQTMADHLAVAIKNATTLKELEQAHQEILRQKTYEALATSTTQAIHWIGNKALPITTTIDRLQSDLEQKLIDAESLKEDLALIDESARLIVKVKENLLGPARETAPRPVLIADVAESAIIYAGYQKGNFDLQFPSEPLFVEGDSTQLSRVFVNLYKNAFEANATRINVTAEKSSNGEIITITVSDDGDGIPDDRIEKIWASFITTKGLNREGLGLPAALHVLSQHQGTIEVQSHLGAGAAFTIQLPSTEPPPLSALDKLPKNILLLDPGSVWAEHITNLFDHSNKSIEIQDRPSKTPKSALILINDTLLDLKELLNDLDKLGLTEKSIVLSTAFLVEKTTDFLKHGIRDVQLKPYSSSELNALLKENN